MKNLVECLANAPVFSCLSESDRAELIAVARRKRFEKGETICWQGEAWPYAAYIASGRVEWAMLSPDGKRQVIFKLGACEVVWGHSLLDDQPMPASLEVVEAAEVLLWPREIIFPILSRHPQAIWDVARVLLRYMRKVREMVYGFAFHPVAGRLARLLLEHYKDSEGRPEPRNLSLDQMAETVGTTRELVSRTLHRFADEGLIHINRVEFAFTDRPGLEELAGQG
ncbi:MAG: Crp/Fnr family transcriptional regulator [Anaerolineales bacterium]|jgi:CRP/FNR family transcriptional regulator|nr:Crp/Fnr family transcriptional regulator [Anaerolineales bacterium]